MATEAVIFQQIVDMNWDQAIYTASPNNTINVAQFAAKGSGTNIGIALTPKGTGYISAQVPDGTTAGGNARGANAVDLQTARSASNEVSSASWSVVSGGQANRASGNWSMVLGGLTNVATGVASSAMGGVFCTSSGTYAVSGGRQCTASGESSFSVNDRSTASALASFASGGRGLSHLANMRAHGGFAIAVAGGSQEICLPLAGKTTTNAEVILTLEAAAKPIMRANTIWTGILHIAGSKSDGSAVARYHRQVTLSRVVNATSLVGSVITLGTDEAAGTSINITANDTDEALSVGVTGVTSETWRWVAVFHGAELAIGA